MREKIFGAIGGAFLVISTIFFSTGHIVIGIITGFVSTFALFATLAEFVAATWVPKWTWVGYWGLMLAAAIGGGEWITSIMSPQDLLLPANEANPPLTMGKARDIPSDGVVVFTGGSAYMTTRTNPMAIIEYNRKPLITLKASSKGALISGEFFAPNGDVIAVLDDNVFTTNAEQVFRIKRDKHSLMIRDKSNMEVLNIRFINRHAFTFSGEYRPPNGYVIHVTRDRLSHGPGISMSGNWSENATTCLSFKGEPRRSRN